MREILFRGKRVDNGEWVIGDGIHFPKSVNYKGTCWIDGRREKANDWSHVVPETVGQYTGLKDKNGKRIFEGDIVSCWSEGVHAKGTVQQRKDGMWIIYPAWQKNIMWGLCPNEYGHTSVEVIGNIHDNPELIGGTENV